MTSSRPLSADPQQLRDTLKHYWGFQDFLGLQERVISSVLSGTETLAILPTGSGKSLCYQLPAIHAEAFVLVVSPLIALMNDQVQSLRQLNINAHALHSHLDAWEWIDIRNQVLSRNVRLLYTSPERLLRDDMQSLLQQSPPDYVAIDEAHCISQWGHDFRPDYRNLMTLRERFPEVPFHGFTATATPEVQKDIVERLGMNKSSVIVGNFDRPNLVFRVQERTDLKSQLTSFMRERPGQSGIIYAISRKDTENIAADLNREGFRTAAYHAGLNPERRTEVQSQFSREDLDAVVATVAFGMGIDRSNVRFVLHAGLPKSIEHYQQEAGRAGRDGLEAECWLFYKPGDRNKWRFILDKSFDEIEFPTSAQRDNDRQARQKLQEMSDFATGSLCRHRYLVEYFGQKFSSKNCGACDVCLAKLEGEESLLPQEEASIIARKIIGCAHRANAVGGRTFLAEVLLGAQKERVIKHGLHQTKSFGALSDRTQTRIVYWINQLIDQDYLDRDENGKIIPSVIGMTLARKGIGEVKLPRFAITERQISTPSPSAAKKEKRTASIQQLEGFELTIFEELRKLRKTIADSLKVPPYMILGDKSLIDIARNKPEDASQLTNCFGVGDVKLRKFGKPILYRLKQLYGEEERKHGVKN